MTLCTLDGGNKRANCKVKDCGQALTGCEVSMQGTASALPPCPPETRCNYALWYQCKAIHCTMPMQVWIHAGGSSCSSDVGLNVRQCTVLCQTRCNYAQDTCNVHPVCTRCHSKLLCQLSIKHTVRASWKCAIMHPPIIRLQHTTWWQ